MIKYKRIGLFVGHSKLKDGKYTSANGVKNEYLYNKELGTEMKKLFDTVGQACDLIVCPEGKFATAKEESGYKRPIANSGKYDLVVELHLNAFNGSAKGSEVLYISDKGKAIAQRVQNKLKTKFSDRGIKKRDNLYMLKVNPVSIMLETFFTDSVEDCRIADSLGVNGVAKLIVEGILDITVNAPVKEPVKDSNESTRNNIHPNGDIQRKGRVVVDALNVRSGRGTNYAVIGQLKKGDVVDLYYCLNGWSSMNSKFKDANGKSVNNFVCLASETKKYIEII